MLEEIQKKHVVLSMGNGHILEGFVDSVADQYLVLIEQNNQKVIVKVQDISFVRLGMAAESVMHRPIIQYETESHSETNEEFSMPLPRNVDNPYVRQPSLVRRSER